MQIPFLSGAVSAKISLLTNSLQAILKSSKLPFDEIVKNIECERNPSYSPVYQYFLSYQNFIYDNVTLGKAAMTAEDIESYSVRMDLNLIMKEFPDGIHINAEYDTDLFTKAYIKQITDNYITVIERILNSSDTPIDDITLNASNNSIRSESISDSLF